MFISHCKKTVSAICLFFAVIITALPCCAIEDFTDIKDGDFISLEDCINIALINSPKIKKFENLKQVAKSHIGQAKSAYFPTLGLTTGYFVQSDSSAKNTSNYYNLNLSANQLIWDFGKSIAKINMQKFNYTAADYDLQNTILETVSSVKLNYYDCLSKLAKLHITERAVKINELHVERTKELYAEGLRSKIDLINAQVYLTESQIERVDANSNYLIAIVALNNSMYVKDPPKYQLTMMQGFDIRNDYLTDENIHGAKNVKDIENDDILTSGITVTNILKDYDYKPYGKTMEECLSLADVTNPSLLSLNLAKKAATESLKSVKRMYYPAIKAGVGYTHRNTHELINNGFNAQANLSMPDVNIMDVKTKVDEAKSLLEIAQNNIDIRSTYLHFLIRDIYGGLYAYYAKLPLRKDQVSQTLENFKLADGRYTAGLGNFIELQEAHNNYNKAQLAYVQTVLDYNKSIISLELAMGVK